MNDKEQRTEEAIANCYTETCAHTYYYRTKTNQMPDKQCVSW
jgi:hypothetical protein